MAKKQDDRASAPRTASARNVAAAAEGLVRPVVEGLGLRLWDLRFEKEGSEWFLRVLIDRDEPIDTDACELVSRAVDPLLDEADLIEHGYYLEVGSPGLGRKLTRDEHFAHVLGEEVEIKRYKADEAGRKVLRGVLSAFEDGVLELETGEGPVRLERKAVASARLCDDEDLFG